MSRFATPTLIALTLLLVACGDGTQSASGDSATTPAPAAAPAVAGGPQTPDAGGRVVTVEMLTDEEGNNIFRPAEVEAHPGDVVRFTLVSGVHNVNFLPDSNPGAANLPPQGAMLQAPGQTYDVKVSMAPGHYYFQCDPHALLGMIGRLEVEKR